MSATIHLPDETITLDDLPGITVHEFENMTRGLKPCGCGTIDVEPSLAYPTGRKVVRCPAHRGVRVYGGVAPQSH